jgi:hypothetical protein
MAGLVLTSLGQPDTLPQEVVKGSSEAANLIVQGKALLNSEPDRCLDFGLQALVAAKNDGDSFSEALALELLAEANYRLGEYETSHRNDTIGLPTSTLQSTNLNLLQNRCWEWLRLTIGPKHRFSHTTARSRY